MIYWTSAHFKITAKLGEGGVGESCRAAPRLTATVVALVLTLGLAPNVGRAQETGEGDEAPTPKETMVEEITVTAEKREESVQKIGIAITVFTATEIEKLRLRQPLDLAAQTPNLDVKLPGGNGDPVITIRGVGFPNPIPNANPSAGVYVDEVFLTSSAMMNFQLFDIERVEVLKGPQGTLYGRNTTAGAINLVTRKPSAERSGRLALGYGNFETLEFDGAFGGALSDRVFGRLAGYSKKSGGGQFRNRFFNEEYGEIDHWGGRALLDIRPADDLLILLKIHGGRDQSDGFYYEHLGFLDPETFSPCAAFLEGRIDPTTCVDFGFYSDPDGDPFAGDWNLRPYLDNKSWGASLAASWIREPFTLTSITGYEAVDDRASEDGDSSPVTGGHAFYNAEISQLSQEVRLTSNRPLEIGEGKWLSWIAGAFFSIDEVVGDPYQTVHSDDWFLTRVSVAWDQDTKAAAVFGHTDWQLTDELNLSLGLRYTWEHRAFQSESTDLNPFGTSCLLDDFCDPGFTGPVVLASSEDEISSNNLSGKIGVEYSLKQDWLLYGSLAKGFKSGGFNGGFAFSDIELVSFEEEELYALELGLKATLAGGRASFHTGVFFYDYRDLQLYTVVDAGGLPQTILTNASDARITGLEAEFRARPLVGLDLRLGIGLLDTELVEFVSEDEDLSGNELVNAPGLTASGHLYYQWNLAEGSTSSLGADWSYRDELFTEVTNSPIFRAESHWLLGARWGLDWQRFGVAIWGRNLTDEVYITDAFDGSSYFSGFLIYGMPRTYGLTVSVGWD